MIHLDGKKFIRRFGWWLLIPLIFSTVFSQKSLLDSAKKDYLQGDFSKLKDKLEVLLTDCPEHPTVRILKGLTLISSGKIEDILSGKELIEKNALRHSEDPFSNYALGMLYKEQNQFRSARKYFLKALARDENLVPAIVELGADHAREVRRYYNRYTNTEIPLSYRRYALDDYDHAVSYLRKALRLDPTNREAAYILGSLYYDMEEYKLMTSLFLEMKKIFPEDKDVNLFLGLSYLAKRQYPDAYQSFTVAMEKMNPEEYQQFLSPEYLLRTNRLADSPEQINIFWSSKDPMFLTEENERLLEHFGRFAYANLAFGVPKLKIAGWQTDRGKTYIRYGKPQHVIEYGKSMEFDAIYPPMQIWVYPQFQLSFSDEFWNGMYQFTEPSLDPRSIFKERTPINYSLVAENVFSEWPEHFDFKLSGGTFIVPYQIYFFKDQNQTLGYLTFGLPKEEEIYYPTQKFTTALFILGTENLPTKQVVLDFEEVLKPNSFKRNQIINSLSFYPDSNTMSYSFEILNRTLNKNFVDRQRISIPIFSDSLLSVSDVVLADHISIRPQTNQLTRNNFTIYPNISQIFHKNDTLFVYFEIYNLFLDQNGMVHYTVESGLTKKASGGLLATIFGKDKKMSVVNEYSGRRTSDFVIQSVDIRNLEGGIYDFEIVVRDEVKNGIFSRKTEVRLLEPFTN